MCRHLAYLGAPATLRSVIVDPPHGLYRQAWAPRFQRPGAINADGFGVGWYPAGDPEPARYRQAVPIWADESFADVARVTLSGVMLAAVRNATPGTTHGPAAAAPFRHGRWLFSHNGAVDGWPEAVGVLAATLPAVSLLELDARVDSALVWALVLHRLRGGLAPAEALADTAEAVAAAGVTGRFNLLLTDGRVIAGTAAGHTLYYRQTPGSITVASEPGDDEPGWTEIPRGSLVTATLEQVVVMPLPALDAIITGRPADETPPDETPPDETPPDETPPHGTPADEIPADQAPSDGRIASVDVT
jgi:gamma-glutamyl hercynylcysteine S-oxide hydrolase